VCAEGEDDDEIAGGLVTLAGYGKRMVQASQERYLSGMTRNTPKPTERQPQDLPRDGAVCCATVRD
jgi:hypothetical protein